MDNEKVLAEMRLILDVIADEKPGECPSSNNKRSYGFTRVPSNAVRQGVSLNVSDSIKAYSNVSQSIFPPPSYTVVSFGTLQQCVGDYTCPNHMKCCSAGDTLTYTAEHLGRPAPSGKRAYYQRHRYTLVHGYCMEPVFLEKVL